jgi:hypothetical protein
VPFINIAYYSKNHKFPEALRRLARRVLNASIQTGAHSSIIDARATMALFRMNMRYFEVRFSKSRGKAIETINLMPEAKDKKYQIGEKSNMKFPVVPPLPK